jgi:hypothetical protein
MENLLNSIDSQRVLLVAAIVVVILAFNLLGKLLRQGFGQVIAIAAIMLVLNYAFDITPRQLWFEISHLPTIVMRFVQSLG